VGAAGGWSADLAIAVGLLGAMRHVGRAAATLVAVGDAAAVVDDIDGQVVGDGDLDDEAAGPGVAHGVAYGFDDDRFGMLG
jgi:hypothetical protein